MTFSNVNYSHHAYYIPSTYLFYNWKFVSFQHLFPFPSPSTLVTTNNLISFSILYTHTHTHTHTQHKRKDTNLRIVVLDCWDYG